MTAPRFTATRFVAHKAYCLCKSRTARSISCFQFTEEAGTLEIVLLICRVGNHYYPGNKPLHLAIKDHKEIWDLVRPLSDLICKTP